jgi:hypothetical protein
MFHRPCCPWSKTCSEILSLFFMLESRGPEKTYTAGSRKAEKLNEHRLKYDRYAALDVPAADGCIPHCLRKVLAPQRPPCG